MEIQALQTAFGQTSGPAPSLAMTLPRPTAVGHTLSLYLRFSPLTGTPALEDNFGNAYRRVGITNLSATQAVAFFTASVVRGGLHTVTATSQGGSQSMEMGASELSALGPVLGAKPNTNDLLLALLAQQSQTSTLLQRIATALRA